MARYNCIRKMDIADGPGVRISIFFQGCSFHCENCFNPETWDFNNGKEFSEETIKRILELAKEDYIKGLSILGGEPLHPKNIEASTLLAKSFKRAYPDKNIWLWTGFLFDRDLKDKEILEYLDVIVDGQYVDKLHDFRLQFRGSSNQRLIDVKKSLKENKICEYEVVS